MARYRLAGPAKADISSILRRSEAMHGSEARIRYRALLTAALRRIAARPADTPAIERRDLIPGVWSFHIRHARLDSLEAPVGDPVHVIFYRRTAGDLIEIIRVLYERMEPGRHVGTESREDADPQEWHR